MLEHPYPLDDWNKEMIADSQAGKFDKLIAQLEQNCADGEYEILADRLERCSKAE